MARYRLIDTASGEIGIVDLDPDEVEEDADVALPSGVVGTIVEIYDDEHGQEGGVAATLVVDDGS